MAEMKSGEWDLLRRLAMDEADKGGPLAREFRELERKCEANQRGARELRVQLEAWDYAGLVRDLKRANLDGGIAQAFGELVAVATAAVGGGR